jgi:sugar fermentation stimulation protein A
MTLLHAYPQLIPGTLVRRYKRFLADVAFDGGPTVTAFCPNSGSMLGLNAPGLPVMLSASTDPARKTAHTLELVRASMGPRASWVGVNTHLTNTLAAAIADAGLLDPPLGILRVERREVTVGRSRLDLLLSAADGTRMLAEVKSVTLRMGTDARFPDAVTAHGAKHLEDLRAIALDPARFGVTGAAMVFVIQRADCRAFSPADQIDPAYARALAHAADAGVHIQAHAVRVTPRGVSYKGPVPWSLARG